MDNSRDAVFDRVVVDRLVLGGTRVSWRLQPDFPHAPPYSYTLLFGESSAPDADDWAAITTGTNVFSLVDTQLRDLSTTPATHYRVRIVAGGNTHTSRPIPAEGLLPRRDWNTGQALARRFLLNAKIGGGAQGWLYRRRTKTAKVTDPAEVDPLTGHVLKTINTSGVGTDRIGGYFPPTEHFMVFVQMPTRQSTRHPQTGPTDNKIVMAQCLSFPEIAPDDVWVEATSDIRYTIGPVTNATGLRHVPLIYNVELHQLSPTAPHFDLPRPELPPQPVPNRAAV